MRHLETERFSLHGEVHIAVEELRFQPVQPQAMVRVD